MIFGPLTYDLSLHSRAAFPQRRLYSVTSVKSESSEPRWRWPCAAPSWCLCRCSLGGAFLVFVSLQFGWGLRADQGQSDELRTGKCCCYRPATWHVYTNPFGKACPLEGDTWSRGCVKGLGKAAPCANGPTREDVYCEIYYALDCNSTLRNPAKIMWNKPWEKRYRELTLRKLTTEGWEDMARRPLYNITGNVKESTTVPYHHTFDEWREMT